MRVERDERGDYVLDPMALGQRFSISLDELRRRMRLGPRHEPCGGRRRRTRGIASIDGVVWRGGLASRHQCRCQILTEEVAGEPALSRLVRRATQAG